VETDTRKQGKNNMYGEGSSLKYFDELLEQNVENIVRKAGFMSYPHYVEHRNHVMNGMIRLGSTFTIALGVALSHAELDDSLKIMRYWNQLCEQHAILYKMMVAKEKAETEFRSNVEL
jgi:hypothetical protein